MDIIAHVLWTYLVFYGIDRPLLAILFGVLPDIISFGPNIISTFFRKGVKGFKAKSATEFVGNLPPYVFRLYNVTHSIVTFGLVFGIVWLIAGAPFYMLSWALHILFDIPTHNRKFFPVRFLYPLSRYAFPGVNWNTTWLMAANWSSILAVFFINVH